MEISFLVEAALNYKRAMQDFEQIQKNVLDRLEKLPIKDQANLKELAGFKLISTPCRSVTETARIGKREAVGMPNEKAEAAIEAPISKAKNSPKRVKFDAAKRTEISKDCGCSADDVKATLRENFQHYNPEGKRGAPVWYMLKS